METTIIGLYGDKGEENGNYYLGFAGLWAQGF